MEYDVVASEAVREHWHRSQPGVSGAVPEEGGKDGDHGGQRPLEGECPICYDAFKSGSEQAADQVVWCKVRTRKFGAPRGIDLMVVVGRKDCDSSVLSPFFYVACLAIFKSNS